MSVLQRRGGLVSHRRLASGQESPYEIIDSLVEKGLRAQLRTGSLLTGQLFIQLDMHPESDIILAGGDTIVPELPTVAASNFDAITAAVERFVENGPGLCQLKLSRGLI